MMTRMMMSSGIPMVPNMSSPCRAGNRAESIIPSLWRVLAVLLGVVLLWPAGAGVGAAATQFSSGVNLVEVYASVVDAAGQPVRGLRQGDFEVLEDGTPQTVSAFAAGDFP